MPPSIKKPEPPKAIKMIFGGVWDVISTIGSYIVLTIASIVMRAVDFLLDILKRFNTGFVRFSKASQSRLGARFSTNSKSRVGMMVVYAGLSRNPEDLLGIVLMYSIMLSVATTFHRIRNRTRAILRNPPKGDNPARPRRAVHSYVGSFLCSLSRFDRPPHSIY